MICSPHNKTFIMVIKMKKYNYFNTTFIAFKSAFKDSPGIICYQLFVLLLYIPQSILEYVLLENLTNKAYEFASGTESAFLPAINYLILIILIILVIKILNDINSILSVKMNQKLAYLYFKRFNKKLSKVTFENYETQEVDSKINLVKNYGTWIYTRVGLYSWQSLYYSLSSIGIFIFFTSRLPWWVVLVFIFASLIYIVMGIYFGKKLFNTYDELELTRQRRNYFYFSTQSKETHQDSLMNRLTIPFIKRWRYLNDYWNDKSLKTGLLREKFEIIPNIFYAVISIFILYFVVIEIACGNQEIGYFSVIISNIISFGYMLKDIGYAFQYDVRDNNVYKSYLEIMDLDEDIENNNQYLPDKFTIEFKNVTFTYPQSENKALNDFNIKIHENEIIAIVGFNGSGKTTFVNLLTELTKKYQGEIIVNGKIINDEMGTIKNSTSCIFQDFLQYSFTIKQNICLGNLEKDFTDEEIENILDKVGLLNYVKTLPNGINTMLGQIEKGVELSKGEWQRLAIARLLANEKSKIWVLDEPTAFLDPMGEIEIYNLIKSLRKDKTIIFISHRLGFSRQCDRILVFDKGRIVEDDTPENLMNNNTLYKEMYDVQRKWYE